MAYEQAAPVLEHVLGLGLSTSSLARLLERDAAEVVAFYEQQDPPQPAEEAAILVLQADGKAVPMRPREPAEPARLPGRLGKGQKRTKKKEAVVTSLYTLRRRGRSAEEVIASFFNEPEALPEAP